MNERIRDLAKDCDLDWHRHWNDDNSNRLEKFAELIVRECVAQCEKNAEHTYLGLGSKLSAFNIKEHFGVDE